MTDAIPPLTAGILRAQFDPQTWERARAYVRNGAVHETRRYGATLKADVTGSAPEAYRVEVTLGKRGIVTSNCSCPVGEHGECKHVAAVLQLWLAKPVQFVARDAPEIALARLDHDELVAFATRAVARYPDLERLLDTPFPTGAKRTAPVNAQMYRQRVAKAVGDGSGSYGDRYGYYDRGGPDTRELYALVRDGDIFARAGDYEAAMAVYVGMASEIMDNYEEQYGWDEEGETLEVVGRCFDGLCVCLLHATDAEHREEIVEAMYVMSRFGWDIPTEENIEGFLVAHANAHERKLLVQWAREGLSPLASPYERQRVGRFIFKLEADTLDDDMYLRICEEMGLVRERVEHLFTLGRAQEAIAAASQVSHEGVLAIAALLVEHDEDAAAERLVREQATGTRDYHLLDWLRDQVAQRGDLPAALAVAKEAFDPEPSLARYRRTREIATALGRWETVRPEMIAVLQPTKYRDVWIQVALDEGDIDRALTLALASLQAVTAYPSGWAVATTGSSYVLTVAQAADATHPDGTRAIYERMAELAIGRKNRGAYQEACGYLTHVRDLYDRIDRFDAWVVYRDGLRARYPKLRALREEMASAGLLD